MAGPWKIAAALPLILTLTGAATAEPKVAVFDFELVDTSLEGAIYGPRADQQARLARLGSELRDRLAKSGRVEVVNIALVEAKARTSDLRECVTCADRLARELGAQFSVVGGVQKVSNLILNMNIVVGDAESGRVVSAKSTDLRGNTAETWSRALDWLVQNDLLAPSGAGAF
jgi:Protein of unknown function (DUF2380)